MHPTETFMVVLLSRCIRSFFLRSKKTPYHPFTIYLQLFSWKPLQKLLFLLLIYYDLDVIVPALQKATTKMNFHKCILQNNRKKQHYGENTSPTLNGCHIHFLSVAESSLLRILLLVFQLLSPWYVYL